MKQDRFDELLRDAQRTYNRPPEPPLDAMWRAVEPAFGAKPWWTTRGAVLGAMAATLLIGIAVGRFSSRGGAEERSEAGARSATESAATASATETPIDAVTDRYLSQAAALLIALPNGSGDKASRGRLSQHAAELLVTTRLLLDSRNAQDPQLRSLLEDLELVLAQIARLPNERGAGKQDMELIRQALDQHDVIPRLRDAVSTINASDD